LEDVDDDSDISEELIDLRNHLRIQMEFTDSRLDHFWASQLKMYPLLAKKVVAVLVPFTTTYLKLFSSACFTSEPRPEIDWTLNTTCK